MQQDTLTTQVGGDHYKDMPIQPTEFIHANGIGFIAGNVIKYVCRHKAKGGKQDLEKAAHYLQMLIAMEYPDKCEAFDGAKHDCPRWQNGCCDCEPKPKSISNCQLCGEFRGHGHDCEPKPQADSDGWIPWGGGECPVADSAKVIIKLRRGKIEQHQADECDWLRRDDKYDIVAYKLA